MTIIDWVMTQSQVSILKNEQNQSECTKGFFIFCLNLWGEGHRGEPALHIKFNIPNVI